MSLDEASRIGNTQDVINAMKLFIIIFKFVTPFIALLIFIEIVRIINKTSKRKAKQNEIKRKQKKEKDRKKKEIDKLYENDEWLMKRLDDTYEPFDKSAYNRLDLTFDKNGKAIK